MMTTNRRAVLGLTLAGAVALALPAMAQDVLRVGSYPANPPWEFRDEAGNFQGFEVDIVNEVAERLGTSTEIEGLDFRALFVATASQRVDMAISSLTITDERLETQSFTQPYFTGALGVAVRNGSDIETLEDLRGKRVGSVATTFPEAWLQEREAELGYASYSSYDNTTNMLSDLANGRLDAVMNDIVGLLYSAQQGGNFHVPIEVVTGEKFAMMMPKDSPLLEDVNAAISAMKEDGTMAALHEKWFGVPAAPDSLTLTPLPVPTSAD